jgi:hypothetical protein
MLKREESIMQVYSGVGTLVASLTLHQRLHIRHLVLGTNALAEGDA